MTLVKVDWPTLALGEELDIGESTESGTETRYLKSAQQTYRVACLPATQAATCDLELNPSLSQMFLTWLSAVRSER